MLTGHVQDMIQRIAANRRKRQPRSKKEKMLDLLRTGRRNSRRKRSNESKPKSGEKPDGNGAGGESWDGYWRSLLSELRFIW